MKLLGNSFALTPLRFNTRAVGKLDPKVTFLNSVFLFAGIVAFGMSFVRWQTGVVMSSLDLIFSLCSFALIYYLNTHRERIEAISLIALILVYCPFTALYLLASQNTTRISLFFLLSASAFFLRGRKYGRDITERKRMEVELEHHAHIDVLTRLNNRRHFFVLAEQELARGLRYHIEDRVLVCGNKTIVFM